MMKDLPLAKVYQLLEPGPVVLLTTARKGRANVMTMSWHMMVVEVGNCSGRDVEKFERFGLTPAPAERVAPPLVAECFANLECKVADTRLVDKYNLFILEVLKAWIDPAQKNPKTIHHHGYGRFAVDGEMIKLKSRMR